MWRTTAGLAVFVALAMAPAQAAALRPEPLVLGPFVGVLACADCPGIRTELTLRRKAAGWAEGTYLLRETYIDRGAPKVSRGDWTTLRGDALDEDAVVYELNPDQTDRARHFRKDGEGVVQALDRDLRPFPAGQPSVLTAKPRR